MHSRTHVNHPVRPPPSQGRHPLPESQVVVDEEALWAWLRGESAEAPEVVPAPPPARAARVRTQG